MGNLRIVTIGYSDGYRQLAARIVYEGILELKANEGPATREIMPAYEFLTSPWGLFLAEAGADIEPDVMRAMAEGWGADNRRLWAHGLDATGMQLELRDQAEEILEKEEYITWTQTKIEALRHRKMKGEHLTTAGDLL